MNEYERMSGLASDRLAAPGKRIAIVRKNVDEALFLRTVQHIRSHGYEGHFYQKKITYFDEDGLTFWTMGAPIDETTIINRCRKEHTYEERLKRGTLPG